MDTYLEPDEIKQTLDTAITQQVQKPTVGQVGVQFMRFCGKWDLQRISDQAQDHAKYLNASYG